LQELLSKESATCGDACNVTDFYLVQHSEKAGAAGDPGLSPRGMRQAEQVAAFLQRAAITRLVSSPLRRARETAQVVARVLNLPVAIDTRLRERMNWGESAIPQTRAAFLADWVYTTQHRDCQPQSGDSSRRAGDRLLALLEKLAGQYSGERVALVTHGGVTVDALRNLFADEYLRALHPTLIETGPAGGAITHLTKCGSKYELRALCATTHLAAADETAHRP
jgi:broad specificity phosphatase PhoE